MLSMPIVVHTGRTDDHPSKVGMDAGRLEELERFFGRLMEKGQLQGASWLVAREGRIVAHRSMGKRTYHPDSDDLKPDTIRHVYSINKVFTAAAIMMLIEDGKLYLQQSVADWLKPFDTPMHRPITLWHLLTHTSGIDPDPGFDLEPFSKPWFGWWAGVKREQSQTWTADDSIRLILSGNLRDKPGRQWMYSTAGYALLAEVVRRASGMPFEQFLEERIFKPLGMNRTFFRVPESLRSEVCVVSDWEEEHLTETRDAEVVLPPGGNGMYSTLEDLWKFGQAMLDGGRFGETQILGRRMVGEMVSNQLKGVFSHPWGGKVSDYKYGLGWSLQTDDLCSPGTFCHEGFGRCMMCIDPVEKIVFVYFVPTPIGWVPESVTIPQNIVWSALL